MGFFRRSKPCKQLSSQVQRQVQNNTSYMKTIRGKMDVLKDLDLDDHLAREPCFLDIYFQAKGRIETLPQGELDAMQLTPPCFADYRDQLGEDINNLEQVDPHDDPKKEEYRLLSEIMSLAKALREHHLHYTTTRGREATYLNGNKDTCTICLSERSGSETDTLSGLTLNGNGYDGSVYSFTSSAQTLRG